MATIDDVAAIAAGLPELEADPTALFTIPHFDGHAAVLVRLRKVSKSALREVVVDGWLACAADGLARSYVAKG